MARAPWLCSKAVCRDNKLQYMRIQILRNMHAASSCCFARCSTAHKRRVLKPWHAAPLRTTQSRAVYRMQSPCVTNAPNLSVYHNASARFRKRSPVAQQAPAATRSECCVSIAEHCTQMYILVVSTMLLAVPTLGSIRH